MLVPHKDDNEQYKKYKDMQKAGKGAEWDGGAQKPTQKVKDKEAVKK